MDNKQYYIKYVYGPGAQEGYPDDNIVHFAEGCKKQYERFKNCSGFLLYETSHSHNGLKGTKAIYAWGLVNPNQENLNLKIRFAYNGKRFDSGVRVILKKRVEPKDGIPLKKIRELIGSRNIQRRGGLFLITENQFEALQKMLEAENI